MANCDSSEPSKTVDFSRQGSSEALVVENLKESRSNNRFKFGFDLRSSIEEDLRQYQPLITYLSGVTGYQFELILAPKGNPLEAMLGRGDIHFAAIGAVTHIKTEERYGAIPVVRGINAGGKTEYQAVIVTQPDSQIGSISALAGKRIAFGRENSTQGYLIPRIDLESMGIDMDDLKAYGFMGSHRDCANAVISGHYDACGMQDTMGRNLEAEGLVRIIHTSDYYPSSGISASPGLPHDVIEKVREALIAFEPKGRHSGMLYSWEKTEMPNGFRDASSQDYAGIRQWMRRFGLLLAGPE